MIKTQTSQILLLPGFDGTGKLFAPLQSALGSDIPAIPVYYRDERVFDDYVESVASLLSVENTVLVAESFSGPVALALMSRYPTRIRCAVLCATFAVSPFRLLTRLARFTPTLFFGPAPTQSAILRTFCLDKESDPELLNKALSVIRSVPASTIKERLNVLSGIDMRPLLPQIKAPVLYLQAMQDKVVGANLSQQLVSRLPNVKVHELNGPHLLLQCHPQKCAEVIIPFIASNYHHDADSHGMQ